MTQITRMTCSVAKRENVPPTTDTPKNCLPFYKNQNPLHKLIITSYRAVLPYPLFTTMHCPKPLIHNVYASLLIHVFLEDG